MIVITLTDCPPALRGDLTKWLQEVNTGVYVGRVSARVRDILWKRVRDSAKSGRATMVFTTNNEQHMDLRVHNTNWEPIDFDGLKLMLRPSPARIKKLTEHRMGYSKASRMHKARQMSGRKHKSKPLPKTYVVVEIETKGLSTKEDELLNIFALKVSNGQTQGEFQPQVNSKGANTPRLINEQVGLTEEQLGQDGRELAQVLPEFLAFVGDMLVVSHDTDFIYRFLRSACERCGLPLFSNQCVDIIAVARRMVEDVKDYKLETLLKHFNIETSNLHNCQATNKLYEKLTELQEVEE